jgi:SAM-dependent methyltransferase
VWARGAFVRQYTSRTLRPVEVLMLVRHREDFAGRVLELGVGAGRISGYLVALAARFDGLDLSEAMVAECRRRYPAGTFATGDMRDLSRFDDDSHDAVVAGNNVIDVFSDDERRMTLGELRRVLAPGGLLVVSSHNRAYLPSVPAPTAVRRSDPLRFVYDAVNVPLRVARHRRLRAFERQAPGYAIVSDGSHGFTLVHYYIAPEAQLRQLAEAGFEVLGVADLDGRMLAPGETAAHCSELHYFARPTAGPMAESTTPDSII